MYLTFETSDIQSRLIRYGLIRFSPDIQRIVTSFTGVAVGAKTSHEYAVLHVNIRPCRPELDPAHQRGPEDEEAGEGVEGPGLRLQPQVGEVDEVQVRHRGRGGQQAEVQHEVGAVLHIHEVHISKQPPECNFGYLKIM